MANPTIIDPGIPSWFGIMSLDWVYAPPESTWGGGNNWGDAACLWGNGLDVAGNWGFDMAYDLNNTGNWIICLMTDGNNGSNHNMAAYDWNQFFVAWDLGDQIDADSDACRVRTRIKNRNTAVYSDYGYYGPVAVRMYAYPIFIGFGSNVSFRWQPSYSSDYPAELFIRENNIEQVSSINGRIQIVKHGRNNDRFQLYFPVMTEADLIELKAFFASIEYRRNPFIYRDKEVNLTDPFSNSWLSSWVKLDNPELQIERIQGDYYSVKINLRTTLSRPGLFAPKEIIG